MTHSFYKVLMESHWKTLTLDYVCRKCGNDYSAEEFDKNQYCKSCGSILLKKFSITSNKGNLKRVAKRLRKKSETAKEYEVVAKTQEAKSFGNVASQGWIYDSEFDEALQLKGELIAKFDGKSLEQAIPGKVISNRHGSCYCISKKHNIPFKKASPNESRRILLSELRLLNGIGFSRARALRLKGCRSIEDLTRHPKWRKSAIEFLSLVESGNVSALQSILRQSLPKSHPIGHYLAGFCRNEDFAIIDIETMGLFGRPIILVGVANVAKKRICTRQLLMRDVSEEASALWEFVSSLNANSVFVSFNGRCFDVPYLRERLAFYGLNIEKIFDNPHFDVLHFARRALRNKLGNCQLETVEKYMGIKRGINIPGALVPEFYDAYQRSGNVGPLVAIVEHNKQDMITLSQLFCSLYKEWDL